MIHRRTIKACLVETEAIARHSSDSAFNFPEPERDPARSPSRQESRVELIGAARLTDEQHRKAHENRAILVAAFPALERGESQGAAAKLAGVPQCKLSRLLDLAKPTLGPAATMRDKCWRLLNAPLDVLAPGLPTGRKSDAEDLLEDKAALDKLRALYSATIGASSDYLTSDRRTGSIAATLLRFAQEPECPAALSPKLQRGTQPAPFVKFLRKITPEVEAAVRGPKHFQLHGATSRRDMTVRLPDGTRAEIPAGYLIEFDDMSINQPFWCVGPDGEPMLSRQGLYARDAKSGRWLGFELIARPREAYRAEDILRFLRRLMTTYGRFDVLRLEKGIWAARTIKGFVLADGHLGVEEIKRPGMAEEEQVRLRDGLAAIGLRIHYVSSPRTKGGIESGFRYLQTITATYTREFINIGRHAGEFEKAAKQLRRVRAGSHTAAELGFAHIDTLADRIEQAMGFVNRKPLNRLEAHPDEAWTRDLNGRSLPLLIGRDLAAFLPVTRERQIRGLMVSPEVDGRTFDFRAPFFAELGDGYRVALKFDPSELTLGAAIYNRETSSANHHGYGPDEFIGFAEYEVPGPQLDVGFADARGLKRSSARELYGIDDPGNAGRKRQEKFVRTAARVLAKPNEAAIKAATSRDGDGRTTEITSGMPDPGCRTPEGPKPDTSRPKRIPSQGFEAPTPEQFAQRTSRNADQLAALRKVMEIAS